MHAYLWLLLASCAGSALCAGTVLARGAETAANRRAAALALAACYWAMCEIAWNTAADAATALWLVRLSAPGWIFVGPMAAHVLLEASGACTARARRWLRASYAACAVLLAGTWATPWMHASVHRTAWGWSYLPGPLFPAFYVLTLATLLGGFRAAVREFRRTASPGELRQGGYAVVAFAIPLVAGSLTDAILPWLDRPLPRLGAVSLAYMATVIIWSTHRWGYSVLAPGHFAAEVLEALSDAVVLVRPGGAVRLANRAAGALTGAGASALVGRSVRELLPALPWEPERPLAGFECALALPGSAPIPVSVASSQLRDKSGLLLGVILVVRDLREVTELRSRLVLSGRLAAVGELAAGIAHEINNPISYVRANLRLLGAHWRTLAEALEKARCADAVGEVIAEGDALLDESLGGIDRVAAIVRDVRSISHAGGGQRQRVALRPILERVLRVTRHAFEARIELEAAAELPALVGCAQELEQVFLNLATNAAQAAGAGGNVRIRAGVEPRALEVCVEDDGPGIAPEHLERIFDPFFTTKPQGEGTGLGLAISYQIVRQHAGAIRVSSSPGWTRLCVRLPLADAEPPEAG